MEQFMQFFYVLMYRNPKKLNWYNLLLHYLQNRLATPVYLKMQKNYVGI